MNLETKKDFSAKKIFMPYWLKREFAVFGGMILESLKFILVAFLVFSSIYVVINGPTFWKNVQWWWYVNYIDDKSGRWWGINFPDVTNYAEPDNTLFVPKIGVQAPILFSGSRDADEINNLLLKGVVHYADTANPGEVGNVFITGHSSYYWWSKGEYNSVFGVLDKLVVGDTVYIHYKGKRYTYKIARTKIISPNDLSVLAPEPGKSTLTLMTCTPVGTNYKRLIVTAEQIDPDPKKNKISEKNIDFPKK